MGIVRSARDKVRPKLIVLKQTRKIEEIDLFEEKWKVIKNEYIENINGDWLDKAMTSFLNSIVYSNRAVFIITRESLRQLLKSDENWDKTIGLKDSNYPIFLCEMINGELIKKIVDGTKASVYELISPELLKFINADVEAQRLEAVEFANTCDPDDDQGTQEGTGEGAQEKREIKKQNKTAESSVVVKKSHSHKDDKYKYISIDLSLAPPPNSSDSIAFLAHYSAEWGREFKLMVGDVKKKLFGRVREKTISSFINSLKKIGCDLSDSELVADCFKRLVIEPHVSINRNNKNDVELIEECESYVKDQILMSNFAERKITTTYVDAGVDLTSL